MRQGEERRRDHRPPRTTVHPSLPIEEQRKRRVLYPDGWAGGAGFRGDDPWETTIREPDDGRLCRFEPMVDDGSSTVRAHSVPCGHDSAETGRVRRSARARESGLRPGFTSGSPPRLVASRDDNHHQHEAIVAQGIARIDVWLRRARYRRASIGTRRNAKRDQWSPFSGWVPETGTSGRGRSPPAGRGGAHPTGRGSAAEWASWTEASVRA